MTKAKEKSDIKPIIVKFGVALALSCASFLYSRLRTRRGNLPSLPRPSPQSPRSADCGNEMEPRPKGQGKDETETRRTTPTSYGVATVPPEKYEEAYLQKYGGDNSIVQLSPRSKLSRDREGSLLLEFNDLVKEYDSSATAIAEFSPEDVDFPRSDIKPPKAFISVQKDEHEAEISQLHETVRLLRERERSLEVQLLEFYGLKEQQTTVMELQNRLKLNNMESKLFSLKIGSLQAENQRLEAQVADHANVVAELEAARAKIRLLKKKLRFEAEQNKEQILKLQQRVAKFQDEEIKSLSSNLDIQSKLKRLGVLEGEIEELKKSNVMLQLENSELNQRLESTQVLANSVLQDSECENLREVSKRLRQENEDLRQEIEQLKVDRCSDVEELVYLRWINACLRYELRDYQPAAGKTVVARDLSKTLSPKSEEKAKQLILEYANSKGINEREINFMDFFDSDQWSSSHASFTDSAELDESLLDNSSAAKTNSSSSKKFLSKLRKLVSGKDIYHSDNHVSLADKPESMEDGDSLGCNSSISTGDYGVAETNTRFRYSSESLSRLSFDLPRSRSTKEGHVLDTENKQKISDVGSSCVYKTFVLGREAGSDSTPKDQIEKHSGSTNKSELLKYAEALKNSRRGSLNLHRKSASYSSF